MFAELWLSQAQKFKYIVAARDDLSGTCEARALQHASSKELASSLGRIILPLWSPSESYNRQWPEVKKAFDALLND